MRGIWDKLPFIGRLLAISAVALLLAAAAMLFVGARELATASRSSLMNQLQQELETLPVALAESVVVGDYASLQRLLDHYAAYPPVIAAEFTDATGSRIASAAHRQDSSAPEWFVTLFDFADRAGSTTIGFGGRNYGELHVTLSAQEQAGYAWAHLQSLMAILLLALLGVLLGFWFVLRSGLAPLRQLEAGAQSLAAGDFAVTLPPAGSPELKHVVVAFNQMVAAVRASRAALQESEERLQLAINGVNDGIWDWDLRSGKLYMSPKLKEMIGYAADELPSAFESFERLLHPDDKPRFLQFLDAYLKGGIARFSIEFRLRHRDGSWCWILGRGEALRDAQGVPYRMAGSHTDITLRKNAEKRLQQADQLLRSAIEASGAAFVVYNPDDRMVLCNEQFRQIYARSAPAIVPGLTFEEMVRYGVERGQYPEAAGREEAWIAALLDAHRRGDASLVQKLDDGRWLQIRERRTPTGHVVGFRVDVTELYRAKEAAEAASLAKSRFLATMSHEIRTPLNGVLGMAQLLLQQNLTAEECQDYARTILTSGETLLALLNDILDLSKVEAGRIEMEALAFDPGHLLEEMQALFSEAASAKGLRIAATWHGPAERYSADSYRLRQMLSNLIGNAVKFTATGEVRIEGRETARSGEAATLEFAVTDTGIGIAADKLALLFQPFSQADSTTTRQYGGTGLGLSIVRGLAGLMGGEVGVDSTPGQGSRFWFRIQAGRVAEGMESRRPERVQAAAQSAHGAARLSGRVLVVEDNPTNQKVVASILEKLGLECAITADGEQGVAAATGGGAADLILMDVQMPVLDGYAATQRIRRWESENGRVPRPIIALTANAFETDRQRCLDAGMDDFLSKPVQVESLKAVLSKWLGGKMVSAGPVADAACALPAGAPPVFDEAGMLGMFDGDRGLAQEIIRSAMEDFPNYLGNLEQAVAARDWPAAGRICHTMKGLAAQIGAHAFARRCKELDLRLRDGGEIDAAVIASLRGEFGTLRQALQPWLG